MRYTVTVHYIQVIGRIWMPDIVAAQYHKLSQYDIDSISYEDGSIDRDGIQDWLDCHTGDFQCIDDFYADINDVIYDWQKEESEYMYSDCMNPSEE